MIVSLPLPQKLEDSASVPVTITDITSQELALRDIQKAEDIMLKSSLSVISAVSATVEKRDPYTAGHQNKVVNLCVSIAEELGWDNFRTEGLRLGSMIHDIGKIYVPAEILNRPGKLSKAQLAMVKSHPQVGAEILQHTEFPWPIQQMILQHHERLDGTGYPQGLSGDEIIDEAKIIAVADVMEAMTSHRPYRAALGIELALEEISRGRGSIYDPDVVDACFKVVSADDFGWSDVVVTRS